MLTRTLHGSIRKKLALLFIFSALPAIVIVLLTGLNNRHKAITEAEKDLLHFSWHIAETQTKTTENIKTLLESLSASEEVRSKDVAGCERLFADVLRINPLYGALHLVDTQGNLIASGTARKPANFARTRHFRDALETKGFSTGEYLIGVTLHVPVFAFGCPVFGERGEVTGILLTSIRLDLYRDVFSSGAFPPDSFIGICDRNGNRLYRYPESPATPVGGPIKKEIFDAAKNGGTEGLVVGKDSDGVERIHAFHQVRVAPDQPPYMYVFTGAPKAAFFAASQAQMIRDFGLLFLAIGLTLIIGWYLGGRTVGHRFEEMAAAAKRIGRGDLSARVQPAPDIEEVNILSQAFNSMAESLSEDIERRSHVEEALRESEARFRNLFEQVPSVAVQGYDMGGTTIYWNAASETLYGYTAQEAVGKNLVDLIIPPEIREFVRKDMRSMAETGVPIPAGELSLMRKDGSRVLVFSSHVIVKKPGSPAELFCLDVDLTSRKLAEDALLRAKEAAEAANQAKSEFLANMSHEIRTPINGVMGMLQLMETTSLDAEQSEYVDLAKGSIGRLNRLLADILDLSRIEAGRMEIRKAEFGLGEIAESVSTLFAPTANAKGVSLGCRIDPALPLRFVGDETRVRQVLFNLVGNALKFTDQGRVDLTVEALSSPGQSGLKVGFTITDTGIGIAEDRFKEIFEPFRQVENSYTRTYQGAGLGLAIVQRLVNLMDGEIYVESSPGHGTTMRVVLPLEPASAPATHETAETADGQGRLRILLVEDDPSNQIPIQIILTRAGHEIVLAEDGEKAVEALEGQHFDCVLMDIQMPVMDGVQATMAIRQSESLRGKRRVPIIAMTAYAMTGDREKFLAAGMDGYIAKPVVVADLMRTITEVMQG
ncbi:ATP-binding protein [Desulfomicrobium escambiense]|uniref:ATP-binding protein n=1 Tax=Desulfomicrobium escambiense TaxID=29503 RepID=UPI0004229355|nr:ATP-binding protein [Desulfomicrobium escambiense]